jgi:hypothetical protein
MGSLCVTLFGAPPWTMVTIQSRDTKATVKDGECVDLKPGLYQTLVQEGNLDCEAMRPVKLEAQEVRYSKLDCYPDSPGPR